MRPWPSARLLALRLLLLLFLFSFPASPENIRSIHPTGYVTDLAEVLTPQSRARLESLCTELEQKTSAQMAIVTVRSLEGDTIEEYSNDLFTHLGVGSRQSNRGVLLLVAPEDHKYRVEVGYGLEPVVNDARAGDAGRAMVPLFRQNDYSGGIEIGAWRLAKYIADDRGVTLSGVPPVRRVQDNSRSLPLWPILILLLVFIRIFSAAVRSTSGRRGGGAGWWIGPTIGGILGGGFGGSSRGWSGGGSWGGAGSGFGGFGGGSSGGGGASGSW